MKRYQLRVDELLDEPVPTHGSVRAEVVGCLRITSHGPLELLDVIAAAAMALACEHIVAEQLA